MVSTPSEQYATDRTDAQWGLIEPLRPVPTRDQRPTIKTATQSNTTGDDADKKIQGCTRHLVVERTVAGWMNFSRHARDYAGLLRPRAAFIHIAMLHLLRKRRA